MELTVSKYKVMKLKWIIDDFSIKMSPIESPMFKGIKGGFNSYLCFCSTPFGYWSLYLHSEDFSDSPTRIKFYIVNKSSEETVAKYADYSRQYSTFGSRGRHKMIEDKKILDESSGYLVDDKLTIICEVLVRLNDDGLSSKQEKVFKTKQFTDCVFICRDGVLVPGWKVSLASRSSVFRTMFEGPTEEAKSGRIVVGDVDSAVMQEVCRFVLCGRVENLSNLVYDLLIVADKYGIDELKGICANRIMRTPLTKDNVCHRLMIADRRNVTSIKDAAFRFIKKFGRNIKELQDSEELFRTNYKLAMELCAYCLLD